MSVDTRDKRASVMRLFTPLPLPDGAVGVGDRKQVSWIYAGVLAAPAVPGVAEPTFVVYAHDGRAATAYDHNGAGSTVYANDGRGFTVLGEA